MNLRTKYNTNWYINGKLTVLEKGSVVTVITKQTYYQLSEKQRMIADHMRRLYDKKEREGYICVSNGRLFWLDKDRVI